MTRRQLLAASLVMILPECCTIPGALKSLEDFWNSPVRNRSTAQ
jgi:hypothetical protein